MAVRQSNLSEIEKLFASKLNLADKKLQAERNVQKEIHKNKEVIFKEFCQPIWEFILYVHHRSDIRFIKPKVNLSGEYLVGLLNTYGGNNTDTSYNERSYQEGIEKLSYSFDTMVGYITFGINDSYQPFAYFGSYGNADRNYRSPEEFIDELSNLVSRKKIQ